MAALDHTIEEMEFVELGKLLPLLRKDGILTNVEALEIASTTSIEERRSEFQKLLVQKNPQTALLMLNTLRRLNNRIWTEDNFKKHPLQNAMIAKNIMKFLRLPEVLNCRLVCQDWKTGADEYLQQGMSIQLNSSISVSNFCSTLKNSGHLLIPYHRLCLFGNEGGLTICTKEIKKLYEEFGKRLKYLQLMKVNLESKGKYLTNYGMSSWISKLDNLVHLEIDSGIDNNNFEFNKSTLMEIQWNKLKLIKSIKFKHVVITLKENNIRIVPLEICLCKVKFMKDGEEMKSVRLNDIIDFSQAARIIMCGCRDKINGTMILEMTSQEFNTMELQLVNLELENWGKAKGSVNYLLLFGSDFVEKTQLNIRKICSACSKIDFAALPRTIEKVHFGELLQFTCTEEIQFPHLQYMQFGNSHDANQISHFRNCHNLVELEFGSICKITEFMALNVRSIPKNVKRIKFNRTRIVVLQDEENDINFKFELETLILEDHLNRLRTDVTRMIRKIRPKILVVSCCEFVERVDTTDIIRFVKENPQLEKIIIGTYNNLDLHTKIPFEFSIFSDYVKGIKSNYYQFENTCGKPLTFSEFQNWMNLSGSFCEHCGNF